ncbi:hypothetical protein [Pseudobutyrivibrio ruminis]|nr:hypothetical protein [Pseudobutyrivibrio ruminis]
MKRILLFKHWLNKSTKNKFEKNKKISVTAVSHKLGVTHLCLCLANFLSSGLKKPVLYIEISDDSQLLGFVGEHQMKYKDITCYKYMDVVYALGCNTSVASYLINEWDGYVIVDFDKLTPENASIYNQCDKQFLIGSLMPWCKRDVYRFINNMEGVVDMKSIGFLNKSNEINEKEIFNEEKIETIQGLPIINNPFRLKESDFEALFQLIE